MEHFYYPLAVSDDRVRMRCAYRLDGKISAYKRVIHAKVTHYGDTGNQILLRATGELYEHAKNASVLSSAHMSVRGISLGKYP